MCSVKNPPANAGDTGDTALGWEYSLEEEMATNFSILAWKISWTEEPGRLQFIGSKRVRHDCTTENTHIYKQTT